METRYPVDWDWGREKMPIRLSDYDKATDTIGIYELGFFACGEFHAQYVGRAMGVTFKQRMAQHFNNSHNPKIRENRMKLYFRTKAFESQEITAYVEAICIAALEYPWNRRNEWRQHWILED